MTRVHARGSADAIREVPSVEPRAAGRGEGNVLGRRPRGPLSRAAGWCRTRLTALDVQRRTRPARLRLPRRRCLRRLRLLRRRRRRRRRRPPPPRRTMAVNLRRARLGTHKSRLSARHGRLRSPPGGCAAGASTERR